MTDVLKQLGMRIKELRVSAGLTQALLAERVQLSDEFVSRLERGIKAASVTTLERIAGALGVDVKDLFDKIADTQTATARRITNLLSATDKRTQRVAEKVVEQIVDLSRRDPSEQ